MPQDVARRDAGNQDAGENSPHLDEGERKQAADRAPIGPLVIHEIIREQGEGELARSFNGLAWSGLAAGLSIGFSFVAMATLQAGMPDAPWRHLVSGLGYTLGFLVVILGQQQLFTEATLTALIPALTRRDRATLLGTLRVWGIVLAANLVGTWAFAACLTVPGILEPTVADAARAIAAEALAKPFATVALTGIGAGWLIALTVWLLPGAGPARPLIIVALTYAIALCGFPHVIAGSVESTYAVLEGLVPPTAYVTRFLVPTLIGNTIGGTLLVALLNHAPLAGELGHVEAGGGKHEQD